MEKHLESNFFKENTVNFQNRCHDGWDSLCSSVQTAPSHYSLSSGRVLWRAFWRPLESSRRSSMPKASVLTAPSEHTWSLLEAQPALGSEHWRPSGPGAWRSTRPCSLQGHPRAPCWRRSDRTSTLTIRCFTWKERPRWGPSLPTCPTELHRNTTNRRAARGSSQRDLMVEFGGSWDFGKVELVLYFGNALLLHCEGCFITTQTVLDESHYVWSLDDPDAKCPSAVRFKASIHSALKWCEKYEIWLDAGTRKVLCHHGDLPLLSPPLVFMIQHQLSERWRWLNKYLLPVRGKHWHFSCKWVTCAMQRFSKNKVLIISSYHFTLTRSRM